MDLGQKIRQLRKKKELSLNKLAENAGISKAYLSQLENDVSKQPSAEILLKIASALGITIADLLDQPVRVYAEDFEDEDIPDVLREFIDTRGKALDIQKEDVRMLMSIRYRGNQPKTVDDWEHILTSIRYVMKRQ
ncbi:MAG: helix-turn-helix transcriptional regulator [Candidatus Poribacteria bacterium]|nr:helix-turn-helix transcriptional regulator [Candidatus Poribacteria bacterium]